jgi:hypothetical protein
LRLPHTISRAVRVAADGGVGKQVLLIGPGDHHPSADPAP